MLRIIVSFFLLTIARSIKSFENSANALLVGDQCIDIRLDSTVYQGGTWTSQKDIQTWSCANTDQPNTNQVCSSASLNLSLRICREYLLIRNLAMEHHDS